MRQDWWAGAGELFECDKESRTYSVCYKKKKRVRSGEDPDNVTAERILSGAPSMCLRHYL